MEPEKDKNPHKPPIEEIHKMVAEYNASVGKVFYYTEEEVKSLCRRASLTTFKLGEFDDWWDTIKKK